MFTKLFVIIGIVVMLGGNVAAQNSIISASGDIRIDWDTVQPGYEGETISYEILFSINGDDILQIVATVDTSINFNISSFDDGLYKIGVRAIDNSGNKSSILWSDSEYNKSGSWIIRKDTAPPAMVGGIRGTFN